MRHRSQSAFTLVEILIVLLVTAVIAAIAVPNVLSWQAKEKGKDAAIRGQILDTYKLRYLNENGTAASTAWGTATTDEERYALIRSMLPNAPQLLGDGSAAGNFAPKGFRIELGSLTEPARVYRIEGNEQVYPGTPSGSTFSVQVVSADTAMGVVVGGGSYQSGENVTIYAQPYTGYSFKRWTEGATVLSTDASYTFVVSTGRLITAEFEVAPAGTKSLTISRNSNFAGSVSPASGAFTSGSNVTLTATPNSNFAFDNWSGDIGSANASSASISVTMDRDRIIQANFVRTSVTLSLNTNNAAWGSVSGAGTYPSGQTVSIAATPFPGFRFVRWLDGMSPITTSSTYSYTVNGSVSLTAEFAVEASTGVIAGTYGGADKVAKITVDAQGRVLSAEETDINVPMGRISGIGNMAGQSADNVAITGGSIQGVTMTGLTFNGATITGSTIEGSPIGQATPAFGGFTDLYVQGRFRIPGNSTLSGYGGVEMVNESGYGLKIASLKYGLMAPNGSTPRLTIDDTGRVDLFGSTFIAGPATVRDTFTITNTSGPQRLLMGNQNSTGVNKPGILLASNGDFYFGYGNSWSDPTGGTFTHNLSILSNGRMGFGTYTPRSRLDIGAGNVQFDASYGPFWEANSDSAFIRFLSTGDATGQSYLEIGTNDNGDEAVHFTQAGALRMKVDQNVTVYNNLGVGIDPTDRLDINGSAKVRGGVKTTLIENLNSGGDSGITGGRHYQWGYQEGGSWTYPYPDLVIGYHTGMKFGASSSYGGVRFYNDHPSVSSTQIMSVGDGDNHVRVANNLYVNGSLVLANQGPGSGINADLLDNYDSSVGMAPNTVVVRDGSGHIHGQYGFYSYLNMSHGASGSTSDTVFYSSGDDYIRKNNATGFRGSLNVPTRTGGDASGTWGINITGSAPWGNVSSKPVWHEWVGKNNSFVAELLSWKNYGNSHVIFDGSQGTSPTGSSKSNTNPDAEWTPTYPTLMGFNGSSTYGVRVDTSRFAEQARDNFYFRNVGYGMVGQYDSTKYQAVFAMGASWMLPANGSSPGNLYGLAWTHDNAGGQAKAGLSHQLLVMENGYTKVALGSGIWTSGAITSGADTWHKSSEGYERLYYGAYGRTYLRSYDGWMFRNSGSSDVVWIDNSGNVQAATFNATSARRFKANIQKMDEAEAFEKVLKMQPSTWTWKEGQPKTGNDAGFIAEEINELFPEFVSKNNEGQTTGIDYSRLTAPIVAGVKSLKRENDELRARIETLEVAVQQGGGSGKNWLLPACILSGSILAGAFIVRSKF